MRNFAQQAMGQARLFLNLNSQQLVSVQPDIGFTHTYCRALALLLQAVPVPRGGSFGPA